MPNKRIVEMRTVADVRALDENGVKLVRGYVTPFGQETMIGGWFYEMSRKGAFKKTIRDKSKGNNDIKILWQHDDITGQIIGRTKNRTLKLLEDDYGLAFEWYPPETPRAEQAYADIQVGNVDQMSFRFSVIDERWKKDEDGVQHREIIEAELFEVSPVIWPAYPGTSAQTNSAETEGQTMREILCQAESRGMISQKDIDELFRSKQSGEATTGKPEADHSEASEPSRENHSPAGAQALSRHRARMIDMREREFSFQSASHE